MAKELYVGHISESATEEDIVRLFSVMGKVTSVHLIIDPETREFKRCGYVRMSSEVDPNEVVETLDGALLLDRQITVSIARPKKPGMGKSGPPWQTGGRKKPAGASGGPRSRAGDRSPSASGEPAGGGGAARPAGRSPRGSGRGR